jgi:hypothetical protein
MISSYSVVLENYWLHFPTLPIKLHPFLTVWVFKMTVFGYGRVSTAQQSPENQRLELERAGFKIAYWFEDQGVSGKTAAMQRRCQAPPVRKPA